MILLKNDIREALHNKKFIELNENLKKVIKYMYPNICNDNLISCYEYKGKKINLKIMVNSEIKYLSIRANNSFASFNPDVSISTS